ncbi:MAG: M23 family metallopeptidase [Anaerolineales bacterium]|nr:M23 family metallopeptidase [Anaerolineales bacterium]MCS7247586.1 M23 family metallopeptidase [Anaerolineales bacterium]MDW8161397.1 M23 family metallopeptidase [Anaerolineales bacterium]MDW8448006.1 M23 family metallopeptidase [Anaerolineales bacterium]
MNKPGDVPAEEKFYLEEPQGAELIKNQHSAAEELAPGRWRVFWRDIAELGLDETFVRWISHLLLFLAVLFLAWVMPTFYTLEFFLSGLAEKENLAVVTPTPVFRSEVLRMPTSTPVNPSITRQAQLFTSLPSRPRFEVIKYVVKPGDTLFGIAEKFRLRPETILWANQYTLGDNPHNLRPGQELNILPVDGTYYRWSAGDGLNRVAAFFGVKPEDIINFPGNGLDPNTIGDYANPNIEPGTWLVIPGGRREFVSWSAPEIPRNRPEVAQVLGPGACKGEIGGAVGVGVFIWPTNRHFLSGFDYSPSTNHFGIDIDGETGDAVYAADSGVVVYAGWNNWGYGNVIVINHGNGWQTLYAHLSAINVTCGQSVYQGSIIGAVGSTGNSTGSHLHFEMMYNGTKVNPWDFLPPP